MNQFKKGYLMIAVALICLATVYTKLIYSPKELGINRIAENFPEKIEGWKFEREVPIERAIIEYLNPNVYLCRQYESTEGNVITVAIIYFENKRWGPHDPTVCYTSQGWKVSIENGSKLRKVFLANAKVNVNEFIVEKDGYREIVMFWWFTSEGKQVASRFQQMIYLVRSGFYNSYSGGGMVRISIPFSLLKERQMREDLLDFAESLASKLENIGK